MVSGLDIQASMQVQSLLYNKLVAVLSDTYFETHKNSGVYELFHFLQENKTSVSMILMLLDYSQSVYCGFTIAFQTTGVKCFISCWRNPKKSISVSYIKFPTKTVYLHLKLVPHQPFFSETAGDFNFWALILEEKF